MIKLTGATILASLAAFALATPPVQADVPVIDFAALAQWGKELQEQADILRTAMNQLTQLETTVRDIEDIPRDLMGQVQGLMQIAVQNPLQGITGNLDNLFNGAGTGQCAGSANLLMMNQFHTAGGGDFLGSWINGGAAITAGLQACTNMVLQSTQDRLNNLPQLVSQLQACNDMACATAVNGRIQEEVANINAQTMQLMAMQSAGQLQRYTAEQQILQKQRADAEAVIAATGGAGAAGGPPVVPAAGPATTAPVFTANAGN
jgi:hypothetical protein